MKTNVALGVGLGLLLALFVLCIEQVLNSTESRENEAILSETEGRIREFVLHYSSNAFPVVGQSYRALLSQFDRDVTVHVVVSKKEDFDHLQSKLEGIECILRPIVVSHPITAWARDRWLSLSGDLSASKLTVLRPRGELLAHSWPARAGDQRVAEDIARVLPGVAAKKSNLFFDGGDFVSDQDTVFVTPDVLSRNLQHTVESRELLEQELRHVLKKKVVMFNQSPKHHAGMFMMAVGDKTLVVSDPKYGRSVLKSSGMSVEEIDSLFPYGVDSSVETQHLYDAVANQVRGLGYRVLRVPALHGRNSKVYASYTNVIIDQESFDRRRVYMPTYENLPSLNREARKVWESLGFRVTDIDSSDTYIHGGTIRCLVNVLRRTKVS